jgi:hypothetical protein
VNQFTGGSQIGHFVMAITCAPPRGRRAGVAHSAGGLVIYPAAFRRQTQRPAVGKRENRVQHKRPKIAHELPQPAV